MGDERPGDAQPSNPWGWATPSGPLAWTQPVPDPTTRWTVPQPPYLPPDPPSWRPPDRRRPGRPMVLGVVLLLLGVGAGVEVGQLGWSSRTAANAAVQGVVPTPTPTTGSGGPAGSSSGPPSTGAGGATSQPGATATPSAGSSASGGTGSGPINVASVAAKVSPALVDVNSTFGYQSAQGAGTGIVLTATGEVLTNNHVINGATKISVTDIGNGKTYGATVVGYDPTHDIAVIQLQGASGLPTATLGDSDAAAVGASVVAVGNAGGTGGTPSAAGGSITALNQSITARDDLDGGSEQLSGLIGVDADVQAGDSGGSLVNAAGAVIGMDTAASQGYSFQSAGSQGFAIPINQALATARQIEAGQGSTVVHVGPSAFLGVLIASGSGRRGGRFGGGGGPVGAATTPGATVSQAVDGGAVQSAGITAGDVITSLGGHTVDSPSTLDTLMIGYHPGDRVQLGWTDTNGQAHTATIELGTGPPA